MKESIEDKINIEYLSLLVRSLHRSVLLDDNISGEAKNTSPVETIITRAIIKFNIIIL